MALLVPGQIGVESCDLALEVNLDLELITNLIFMSRLLDRRRFTPHERRDAQGVVRSGHPQVQPLQGKAPQCCDLYSELFTKTWATRKPINQDFT